MATMTASVLVDAPVGDVYRFWTRFEEYPAFLSGVEQVRLVSERRLRWVFSGPSGSWEVTTTIVELRPQECIAWVSDAGVRFAGAVSMEPLGPVRTRVTLTITHTGAPGLDRRDAVPGPSAREALERFREVVVLAQSSGAESVAVFDIGERADLEELRTMGDVTPSTVVCLWCEGVQPPSWFEPVAIALSRRSSVVVVRFGVADVGFGRRPVLASEELAAAVRGAVAGSSACRTPGYREVVVRQRGAARGPVRDEFGGPLEAS